MDTSASKSTQRNWLLCLLAPLALLLSGCNINVTDLTPSVMRANPSNVYTITAQIAVKNSAIIKETLRPEVIIDGKAHPMSQARGSGKLYEAGTLDAEALVAAGTKHPLTGQPIAGPFYAPG